MPVTLTPFYSLRPYSFCTGYAFSCLRNRIAKYLVRVGYINPLRTLDKPAAFLSAVQRVHWMAILLNLAKCVNGYATRAPSDVTYTFNRQYFPFPCFISLFTRVGIDLIKLIKSSIKSLVKSMRINHGIDLFDFFKIVCRPLYVITDA